MARRAASSQHRVDGLGLANPNEVDMASTAQTDTGMDLVRRFNRLMHELDELAAAAGGRHSQRTWLVASLSLG